MILSTMLSSSNWKTSRKPRFCSDSFFWQFLLTVFNSANRQCFGFMTVFNDYKSLKNNMNFRECIQTDGNPVKTGCRDFISGQNFLAQKFTIIFFAVSIGLTLIIFIAICLFQYEKQNRKPIIKDEHDSC